MVEYEGLSVICFQCGLYGHTMESCPTKSQNLILSKEQSLPENSSAIVNGKLKEEKLPLVSVPGVAVEEEYGEWMQAKPSVRSHHLVADLERKQQLKMPPPVRSNLKEGERGTGLRFEVLQQKAPEVISRDQSKPTRRKGAELHWKKKEIVHRPSNGGKVEQSQRIGNLISIFERGETSSTKSGVDERGKNEKVTVAGKKEKKPKQKAKDGCVGPVLPGAEG